MFRCASREAGRPELLSSEIAPLLAMLEPLSELADEPAIDHAVLARDAQGRHIVLTMRRLLRGIFRKRHELLLDLGRCAAQALGAYLACELGADTRPGIVVPIATSGDLLQWHPRAHVLVTSEVCSHDGSFRALEIRDGNRVNGAIPGAACVVFRRAPRHLRTARDHRDQDWVEELERLANTENGRVGSTNLRLDGAQGSSSLFCERGQHTPDLADAGGSSFFPDGRGNRPRRHRTMRAVQASPLAPARPPRWGQPP